MIVAVVVVLALKHPHSKTDTASGGTVTTTTTRTEPSPTAGSTSARTTGRTSSSASPGAGAPSTGSSATTSGPVTAAQLRSVPLIVLNNTTIKGLAGTAATRFREGGWTVSHIDNLQNTILSTCAYYDPSVPNAKAAAQALQRQFPAIRRVEPKFPQLPSGPVVVVLTPDYTTA